MSLLDGERIDQHQREAWEARRLPVMSAVARDVWTIPVPCAGFAIRYTYCYVVVASDGSFVAIDPGLDSPDGRKALDGGMREIGLSSGRLRAVVVTHLHPDHIGLADRLTMPSGAPVIMHETEIAGARTHSDADLSADHLEEWLDECGVPAADRAGLRSRHSQDVMPGLRTGLGVADGHLLHVGDRTLGLVHTPGHTAGHICVVDHDERLIFTGDHVLPTITPKIGITSASTADRDSVAEFGASLRRVAQWPDYSVLPAHQYAFRGLTERCDELQAHVGQRQGEIRAILAEDSRVTVWQVAERVRWSRGWDNLDPANRRAALAETLAHVRHLGRTVACRASIRGGEAVDVEDGP